MLTTFRKPSRFRMLAALFAQRQVKQRFNRPAERRSRSVTGIHFDAVAERYIAVAKAIEQLRCQFLLAVIVEQVGKMG